MVVGVDSAFDKFAGYHGHSYDTTLYYVKGASEGDHQGGSCEVWHVGDLLAYSDFGHRTERSIDERFFYSHLAYHRPALDQEILEVEPFFVWQSLFLYVGHYFDFGVVHRNFAEE